MQSLYITPVNDWRKSMCGSGEMKNCSGVEYEVQ